MCNQCDMCSWRAFTNLFSSRRFVHGVVPGRAIKQKLPRRRRRCPVPIIRPPSTDEIRFNSPGRAGGSTYALSFHQLLPLTDRNDLSFSRISHVFNDHVIGFKNFLNYSKFLVKIAVQRDFCRNGKYRVVKYWEISIVSSKYKYVFLHRRII